MADSTRRADGLNTALQLVGDFNNSEAKLIWIRVVQVVLGFQGCNP
jgi:hypothetical protein